MPSEKVVRVGYEDSTIKSFDDIVVHYEGRMDDDGNPLLAEYYQVKFHVTSGGAVTWESLMDASFINADSVSFLQRLKNAQKQFAPNGTESHFILYSSWHIHPEDPLAEIHSSRNGSLDWHRLAKGGSRSKMGQIRDNWRKHLQIEEDGELQLLLRPLRILVGKNLQELNRELNDKLLLVGLKPVEEGALLHPYEDLARKLIKNHKTDFDRSDIEKICSQADLWVKAPSNSTQYSPLISSDKLYLEMENISLQLSRLPNILVSSIVSETSTILISEYQAELDHAKDLINTYNPKQALEFLEKLEKRIGQSDNAIVKYRLINYIGISMLALRREKEAAKEFIRALQFNLNDDSALYYAALGHSFLDQNELAKFHINKIINQNPAYEKAYSLLIQIEQDQDLSTLTKMVPEAYLNSVTVAHALGYVAINKEDFISAENWFQIALNSDTQNIFDLKVSMANLILQRVRNKSIDFQIHQVEDLERIQIEKAIQLLSEAWETIANTDTKNIHAEILVNRGMAYAMLGRLEESISVLDIALQIEPNNPIFKQTRALLALDVRDYSYCIKIMESLVGVPETPNAEIILAEALCANNDCKQATFVLQKLLAKHPDSSLYFKTRRMLIDIYIETKDIQSLADLYNTIQSQTNKIVLDFIDLARIACVLERHHDALQHLTHSRELVGELSPSQEALDIADIYYQLKKYDLASSIYEQCINSSLKNLITNRLIECLYLSKNFSSALRICQDIKNKYGVSKFICDVMLAIYQNINDLNEAKLLCQEYLDQFSDDLHIKLQLASINYRLRYFEELDTFLDSTISIENQSLETILSLANLYAFRGKFYKFFETLYKAREIFSGDSRIHVAYSIQTFEYELHPESISLFEHSFVKVDSAVCLSDESGQSNWYILVDKSSPEVYRKEINLSNPLAKKLLNKKIGDEIIFRETSFSTDTRKISQIVSKYIYALWDSLKLIDQHFPDADGIWQVKIDPDEFVTAMPQSISSFLDSNAKSSQFAENLYKKSGIPLGTFAKLVQRDVLLVRNGLIANPELGIRCCHGNQKERERAISVLSNDSIKLIIDVTTLLTLYDLNAGDVIVKAFGRLGIAQSTIDLIQGLIEENKARQTKKSLTIRNDGDNFIVQEVHPNEAKQNIVYLQEILIWIENNCDVLPCISLLSPLVDDNFELEKLIGTSFAETVLIASEPSYVLLSDDLALRQIADFKIKTKGVWTQVVLMQCYENALIKKSDYCQMIIKLVALNYKYISIDADILIEAAKMSNWLPQAPFSSLLKFLGLEHTNSLLILNNDIERVSITASVNVLVNFIYELWMQEVSFERRESLVISSINALIKGRSHSTTIINQLIREIQSRFYWLPIDEQRILSLINVWRATHFI
jgi:tetratricopeptide (TPR) repeat protein